MATNQIKQEREEEGFTSGQPLEARTAHLESRVGVLEAALSQAGADNASLKARVSALEAALAQQQQQQQQQQAAEQLRQQAAGQAADPTPPPPLQQGVAMGDGAGAGAGKGKKRKKTGTNSLPGAGEAGAADTPGKGKKKKSAEAKAPDHPSTAFRACSAAGHFPTLQPTRPQFGAYNQGHGWDCDGCGKSHKDVVHRYVCFTCKPSVDICWKCMGKTAGHPDHEGNPPQPPSTKPGYEPPPRPPQPRKSTSRRKQLATKCVASVIPAVFGDHHGEHGTEFLTKPELLAGASAADAAGLAQQLGGSANPPLQSEPRLHAVLSRAACSRLVAFLDVQHGARAKRCSDLRLPLAPDQLASLVGDDALNALAERLGGGGGGGHTVFRLRRAEATADQGAIAFHTDSSNRTMQVPLNGDDEYAGGRLVFATANGFVLPARPAGSCTVHTRHAVHGVTALTAGTRYSLFLCNAPFEAPDLRYLVDAAAAQFPFFDRALALLNGASDEELGGHVAEYVGYMRAHQACAAHSQGVPTFWVELVWRVHLLSPLAYATAKCTQLPAPAARLEASSPTNLGTASTASGTASAAKGTIVDHTPQEAGVYPDAPPATPGTNDVGEWVGGVDLVAALRRQQKTMETMVADGEGSLRATATKGALGAHVVAYAKFLAALREDDSDAVPSEPVDLVWHAHMQFPRRYARDCATIVGRLVNHDDSSQVPAVQSQNARPADDGRDAVVGRGVLEALQRPCPPPRAPAASTTVRETDHGAGKGMFASGAVEAGAVLGTYPGALLSAEQAAAKLGGQEETFGEYVMDAGGRHFVDPTDANGVLLPAHASNPVARANEPLQGSSANAVWAVDQRDWSVVLASVRDIADGEEVFVDYGDAYVRRGYTRSAKAMASRARDLAFVVTPTGARVALPRGAKCLAGAMTWEQGFASVLAA